MIHKQNMMVFYLKKQINQSTYQEHPVSTKNLLNYQKYFCSMIAKVLRRMGFKLNMLIYYRTFQMCIVYLQEDEKHSIICALCRISVLQNIHWQAQL